MPRSLVWLRADLRLHDHPAWTEALAQGEAIPVFVWDQRWSTTAPSGAPRLGSHRARFLHAALADLRRRLQQQGADCWVERGHPPEVIAQLAQQWQAQHVVVHHHPAPEEQADVAELDVLLSRQGQGLRVVHGQGLYTPPDLPFAADQVAELFTDFRKIVERGALVRRPLPPVQPSAWPHDLPPAPSLPTWAELELVELSGVPVFNGGETAALARMDHYLWQADLLRRYKATRNGLLGLDYSSKLSAYLAAGCLSVRTLWHESLRYEHERIANESTYWLRFELLWREFFRLQVAKHGAAYFQAEGPKRLHFPWSQDPVRFRAWAEGQTGVPIVDAAMRELAATGYMGNRARQLVASYLTKNLGLDWRLGASHFEALLIDFEPCANYGNWCYAAGVGQDARGFRYFHLPKQAAEHDPDGAYVRHWCPELSALPASRIHAPHLLTPDEQRRYGVRIGTDYPAPIVDLEASVRQNERLYLEAEADPRQRLGNRRLQRVRQATPSARRRMLAQRQQPPPRGSASDDVGDTE